VALYDFACEACGPFELRRSMARASEPATCGVCGGPARRVFSPPGLALTHAPVRRARDLEERSAHEPSVSDRPHGSRMPSLHRHGNAPPWVIGGC
jgi:putative FmdB family regulatory protein